MTKSAHIKSDNAAIEQAMGGETWRHNARILKRHAKRAEAGEMWSIDDFERILAMTAEIHRAMQCKLWKMLEIHKQKL